ncbi:MAG: universal stress protein [Ilumatobacteraceae bacterium]
MESIVVGVTETETSQLAARKAAEWAAATGGTVHFVTAVKEAEVQVLELGGDSWELNSLEEAREKVVRFVEGLGLKGPHTVDALEGDPAAVLLRAAERLQADLIVVGNVRMQGIGRVLGSVGADVLRQAPCDVLVVKTV